MRPNVLWSAKPESEIGDRRRFFGTMLVASIISFLSPSLIAADKKRSRNRRQGLAMSTGGTNEACLSAAAEAYVLCCKGLRGSKVWKATVGYPGCMAEYVADLAKCEAQVVAELADDTVAWVRANPQLVIGTIVVVGGIAYVVSTGGAGAVVLIPALL